MFLLAEADLNGGHNNAKKLDSINIHTWESSG